MQMFFVVFEDAQKKEKKKGTKVIDH